MHSGIVCLVTFETSHEVGHTVGLNHDGDSGGSAYYEGHNGWAPIMGVGYYASVTQFSKGEYTSANNTQDDTAIIDTYIPRSADLSGDAIATAVPLSGPSISATGIIGTRADADLYKVEAGAGTLSVTAATASPDANLDIQLSLYDSTGNFVTGANPAGLTSGNVSTKTGTSGTATFNSAFSKAAIGTFTFTVTGITLSGTTYNASLNTVTSASIAK